VQIGCFGLRGLDPRPVNLWENIVSAYLIVDNEITDPNAYDEYRRQVAPLIDRFGGRFLVRGGPISHLEGDWKPGRLVIVEFPSMDALQSWYRSPEYASMLALRQSASTGSVVVAQGV
jgi:uncharacterized protein (DUF1330 family)